LSQAVYVGVDKVEGFFFGIKRVQPFQQLSHTLCVGVEG
jgi:hypothetical protein